MLQQLYYTITNKTTPYFIPYFQQKKESLSPLHLHFKSCHLATVEQN